MTQDQPEQWLTWLQLAKSPNESRRVNVMAKRQSLGRGLGALIPDVSRETSTTKPKSGTGAKPAKKVAGVAPKKSAPAKKSTAKTAEKPATRSTAPGAQATSPAPAAIAGLTFAELPVRSIVPNAQQPRQVFDDEALAELVHSIQEVGLLQPIVVRPAKGGGYELVAGERRLRATKKAGFKTIPALIRETADDQMLRDALLENLHRAALTPLEEAAAYKQLLEDFGGTQDELATRLGRSRPQISNTLRLLNLPPAVQRRVAAGVISAGHARALLGLKDAGAIERLASRIVAEGLSVRTVEEIVSLGQEEKQAKQTTKKSAGKISAPGLKSMGDRLSDRLDTRVTVQLGKSRGKVIIEFATLEDLQRIVEVIDPKQRGMFGEPIK
jgi:ParB family chromosome partitioning protein